MIMQQRVMVDVLVGTLDGTLDRIDWVIDWAFLLIASSTVGYV
jgi:hypothetical protein